MRRRGANLPAIGGFNQALVFDIVRRASSGVSRTEIAAQTDLSAQTISNVTRRLLDDGLVREGDKVSSGPGKPRTRLHLVPDARLAVGIHLDPARITYSIVDLVGRVIARRATPTPRGQAPKDVEESMIATTRALIEDNEVSQDRIIGIGIAAPGPVDIARGSVNDPPLLPGWNDVPLRDALAEAFEVPTVLAKDVASATVGELWAGGQDAVGDLAVVYIGSGIGLGIALDHTVLHGATSNLGDIGHLRVSAEGPVCSCGQRGCLGVNVSPARIVNLAADQGVGKAVAETDHARVADAFTALCRHADDDADARALLDDAAADIAQGITVVANMLDVATIVMSGPIWADAARHMLDGVRSRVAASRADALPHPLDVVNSALGPDAASVGAGCQALESAFARGEASPFAARLP
ncbi:ROK family protein [Microbacterium sp. G2-8]|uniref:ROK family protein n=1 Tax=Microbacterium sp. G2-8 TaxID=2842454 RepID=UPI001C89F42F|nr:ROK family protein [Microbacterium sp. G2-8]